MLIKYCHRCHIAHHHYCQHDDPILMFNDTQVRSNDCRIFGSTNLAVRIANPTYCHNIQVFILMLLLICGCFFISYLLPIPHTFTTYRCLFCCCLFDFKSPFLILSQRTGVDFVLFDFMFIYIPHIVKPRTVHFVVVYSFCC